MKKMIMSSIVGLMVLSNIGYAKSVEQTICFSQEPLGGRHHLATLGDNVTLNGGKCKGKTLPQMNKLGWRLIQVVGGLESAFGMVLEKIE
jgi:hypothetical protein